MIKKEQIFTSWTLGKKRSLAIVLFFFTLGLLGSANHSLAEVPSGRTEKPIDLNSEALEKLGLSADPVALQQYLTGQVKKVPSPEAIRQLVKQIGEKSEQNRQKAFRQLQNLGDPAIPFLQEALQEKDSEKARQAQECLHAIESDVNNCENLSRACLAVRRLLAQRPPATIAALLHYFPLAKPEIQEEILFGLNEMVGEGKTLDPTLMRALTDSDPQRRAAAAILVGRVGDPEQKRAVRRLLGDGKPLVRLYAAHGLLAGRDEEGLKTLVGLLSEATPEWAWHAEELLRWVAGKSAPGEVVGIPGEEGARRCQVAWEKWLQGRRGRTDFGQLEANLARPGLQLWWVDLPQWKKDEEAIFQPKPPRICLFGFDGKLRHTFRLTESSELLQTTPLGLVTVGSLIREYNWRGQVVKTISPPDDLQSQQFWRLPSGMTLFFNFSTITRLLPCGEEVPPVDLEIFPFLKIKAWPLSSGEVALLVSRPKGPDGIQLVDCGKGQLGRFLPLTDDIIQGCHVWDFQVLPNGLFLLFPDRRVPGKNGRSYLSTCLEADWSGKKRAVTNFWFNGPFPIRRLPNGNFLVTRTKTPEDDWFFGPIERGVVEVDRWGREVGEWPLPFPDNQICAHPCLNLVRLGFDRPRSLTPGSNNVPELVKSLRSPDPKVRYRAMQALLWLENKPNNLVFLLVSSVATLSDPEEFFQGFVLDLLKELGPRAEADLVGLLHDPAPSIRVSALDYLAVLEEIQGPVAREVARMLDADIPCVRKAAGRALFTCKRKEDREIVLKACIKALTDPNETVAGIAAGLLGELKPKATEAVPSLLKALHDPRLWVVGNAAGSLARIAPKDKELFGKMMEFLNDHGNPERQRCGIGTLGSLRKDGAAAVPALLVLLRKTMQKKDAEHQENQRRIVQSLREIDLSEEYYPSLFPLLIQILQDPKVDTNELRDIVGFLKKSPKQAKPAVPFLMAIYLTDVNTDHSAIEDLILAIGPRQALPDLIKGLGEKDQNACEWAISLLDRMGPEAKEAVPALRAWFKTLGIHVLNRRKKHWTEYA